MAHVHKWKRTNPSLACDCGADGQACEGCSKILDITEMCSDSEGCWLCPECYAEMVGADSGQTTQARRVSRGER